MARLNRSPADDSVNPFLDVEEDEEESQEIPVQAVDDASQGDNPFLDDEEDEGVPVESGPESIDFSTGEMFVRPARTAAKSFSLGLSEWPMALTTAATMKAESLIQGKDFEGAKSIVETAQDEIRRQEAFEQQYPTITGLSSAAGAFGPGGLPMKLATGVTRVIGKGAITPTLKQLAARGAVESAVGGGAELALSAASPEEALERGVVGATLGGAMGAGLPFAGAAVKGVASEAVSGWPGSKAISFFLGVPKELQKKYLEKQSSVDIAPTKEAAISLFEDIQDNIRIDESQKAIVVENIESLIKETNEQLSEAVDQRKQAEAGKLFKAKKNLQFLKEKIEDIKVGQEKALSEQEKLLETEIGGAEVAAKEAKSAAKEQLEEELFIHGEATRGAEEQAARTAKIAVSEYEAGIKNPQAIPFVKTVSHALENLMEQVFEGSKAAQLHLDDSASVPRSVIISALNSQKADMVIEGTEAAAGPYGAARKELQHWIDEYSDKKTGLPEQISGKQAKAVLLQLSSKIDELKKRGEGSEAPFSYASPMFSGLMGAYGEINKELSGLFPAYKAAMKPVSEVMTVYKDLTKRNFKTPSAIERSLNRTTDQEVRGQLSRLKELSGVDVVEFSAMKEQAERLRRYGSKTQALQLLPEVQQLELLREKIRREKSPSARRKLEKSLPLYEQAAEQEAQLEGLRLSRQSRLEAMPEYQQLEQTKKLIALAEADDFNRTVFEQVKNTEDAQALIELKTQIDQLTNPELVKSRQSSLERDLIGRLRTEKDVNLKNAIKEQARIKELVTDVVIGGKKDYGKQIVDNFLKHPHEDRVSPQLAKMLRALDSLGEEEYEKFVNRSLGIAPGQFEELMKAMKIREAMDHPIDDLARLRAFRIIGGVAGLYASIKLGSEEETGEMSSGNRVLSWLPYMAGAVGGGWIGNYMNKNGGRAARALLRNLHSARGIPSIRKIEEASPTRLGTALKVGLRNGLASLVLDRDDFERLPVGARNASDIELDIHASAMKMPDKIRALNQLRKSGSITMRTLKSIMLEDEELAASGSPQEDTRLNTIEEPDQEEMLGRMTKKRKGA